MSLSELAVRRPVAVLMAVFMVLLLGIVSFGGLPIDLYPEMSLPIALIITNYSGAGPQEVETMVTRPLEEVVSTVNHLESINSTSSPGSSSIVVMFDWGTDMDFAALELRENIDMIKGMLPDEVDDPLVFQIDPNMLPVIQVGVRGDMDQVALKNLTEDVMKNRLERIGGVAVVEVQGGLSREISVELDPHKLMAYGIEMDQVVQVLRSENLNFTGGDLVEGRRQYLVRTTGEFKSLEEMGSLVVGGSATGPIHLRELAVIKDYFKEGNTLNRMNGEPTLILSVRKQTDSNTVQVVDRVQQELNRMEQELPGDIQFQVAFDQSQFIRESIDNVTRMALLGGLLAVAVLYLFLGNIQSTVIIGLSIPISIVATFSLMYFRGLSLNMITLAGLALGIGMMVDSSIVILENIFRYRQEGMNRRNASLKGSREVSGAIIAATLTTVVVFLPVVFVGGLASLIFDSLALTVAFALLASLIVALTIIPVLSSKVLRVHEAKGKKNALQRFFQSWQGLIEKLTNFYKKVMAWALRRRLVVVILFMAMLGGSLLLIPLVGYEFLPPADMGELEISVNMPIGTPLEETDMIVKDMEKTLGEIPDVNTIFTTVGGGGTFAMDSASDRGSIFVMLKPAGERELTTGELTEDLRERFSRYPGVEVSVTEQDMSGGGMTFESGGISIGIKGDDLEELERLTDEVALIIDGVEGTREVETSFGEGRPELQIRLDRERAAALGISTYQVASTVRMALEGQVATRYRLAGEEIDVRVKANPFEEESAAALEQLTLRTAAGNVVPIGQVAAVSREVGPIQIQRVDQSRIAYVTGMVAGRDIGRVMEDIQREMKDYNLPLGYMLDYGGEQAEIAESFEALALALLLAISLVYMIMAAQFESLLYPFIIMFSLPQTFIGVVLALALTGRTLNVSSFIGVIMLAGIVVNNGIVLVDYINIVRKGKRLERNEAIVEAGGVRLRPILMTTMTTVLGMLPLALGIGEGAEASAPMATVIIGGLTVSSIMTLILVPVMYSLTDDIGSWFMGRFTRTKKHQAEA